MDAGIGILGIVAIAHMIWGVECRFSSLFDHFYETENMIQRSKDYMARQMQDRVYTVSPVLSTNIIIILIVQG